MTAQCLDRANRFEFSVPVSFWWSRAKGSTQSGKGTTRNISSSGVLVATNECPPVGVAVQLTVFMPRTASKSHAMELHGEGTVVRVESDVTSRSGGEPKGFAASVHFYPEHIDFSERQR